MLLLPFCVTRDGEPIGAVPLRHTVKTNIAPNDVRLDLGMVSEFEERSASTFAGIPWDRWLETDPRERAASVAHMRLHNLINVHTSDVVRTESDRRQKAAKNGA